MSCTPPDTTFCARMAHGLRHKHAADVTGCALLVLATPLAAAWIAQDGTPGMAVVVALAGLLVLIGESFEIFAAGVRCEIAQQEEVEGR